jgi:hypothetical protein
MSRIHEALTRASVSLLPAADHLSARNPRLEDYFPETGVPLLPATDSPRFLEEDPALASFPDTEEAGVTSAVDREHRGVSSVRHHSARFLDRDAAVALFPQTENPGAASANDPENQGVSSPRHDHRPMGDDEGWSAQLRDDLDRLKRRVRRR